MVYQYLRKDKIVGRVGFATRNYFKKSGSPFRNFLPKLGKKRVPKPTPFEKCPPGQKKKSPKWGTSGSQWGSSINGLDESYSRFSTALLRKNFTKQILTAMSKLNNNVALLMKILSKPRAFETAL